MSSPTANPSDLLPRYRVIKVTLGKPQRGGVSVLSFAADVEVGIESLVEGEDFDLEFFFDQQAQGALGVFGSGGIGVEAEHNLRRKQAEQLGLLGGEGSTAGRDGRGRLGLKHL